MDLFLRCVPPSVTAQQKRVRVVRSRRSGKPIPVFFHGAKMRAQEQTWTALLEPHAPAVPLQGPLALTVRLVYPHRKSVCRRDADRLVPKQTKPDAGNASKHLEDVLTRLRFIEDDARISRLVVEKFHGPTAQVGIRIRIAPHTAADWGKQEGE